jgi:hypothetical protein
MPSITIRKPLIIKVSGWFLKLAIFALLLFFIYKQGFEGKGGTWLAVGKYLKLQSLWLILMAGSLVIVNWGIEVRKWRILIRPVSEFSLPESWRQVLTGVAAGFVTPNRLGEHVGRILPLAPNDRPRGMLINVRGSFAQVITTLLYGGVGLLILLMSKMDFLSHEFILPVILCTLGLLLLSWLVYFKWDWAVRFLPSFIKSWWFQLSKEQEESSVTISSATLWKVLGLSFLRFAVYLLQYFLICMALGFEPSVYLLAGIVLIFLFQTLSPGMALIDLGIRGNLALWLLGPFAPNPVLPLSAALLLWMMNLVFPALTGAIWQLPGRTAKT